MALFAAKSPMIVAVRRSMHGFADSELVEFEEAFHFWLELRC